MPTAFRLAPLVAASAILLLTACSAGGSSAYDVAVDSSADACTVSTSVAPSGAVRFTVSNSGDQETEFYVLAADESVAGEVEHVGPGLTKNMVIDLEPGSYTTACKPGMTGDGVGVAEFTVIDGGSSN